MKKALLIMLAIMMVASLGLVGCGSSEEPAEETPAVEQSLTLNARTEPPSLDPALATDSTSFELLRVLFEGLVRLDDKSAVVEGSGMAKSWEVSEDQLTYTFTLKDDITWSNGDPVVAGDFEYAWKRVLNPETAADYAYQLYYLKNGQAYNSGEGSADEVGVKALDAKTLEVVLEAPTPYFLQLTAFGSYYPVNQKVVEANANWSADAATYVSNGPFTLSSWQHDSEVVVTKNEAYWNKAAVKLKDITWVMVNEDNTAYQLFQSNEIHADVAPQELTEELLASGAAKSVPILGTYMYLFNNEDPIFGNENIRKAFSYAIDREALVTKVTKGGQLPATGFVPPGASSDLGVDFREYNGELIEDVAAAKGYLEAGLKELNLTELPTVKLTYNTNEGHQKIAEAIQAMWTENLGVTVELNNLEWKVFLETLAAGDYQIGRLGWLGDYMDPMTFLDMFVTDGGNNDAKYSNTEYDNYIAQAKTTGDQEARLAAMSAAEKIFMEEAGIAPIYYYTSVRIQQDYVKGVVLHGDGAFDYTWTYIEK
ncbi:MAG: peptide ABC transporter substrate-binding protein [Vulcanibacillus sp.]